MNTATGGAEYRSQSLVLQQWLLTKQTLSYNSLKLPRRRLTQIYPGQSLHTISSTITTKMIYATREAAVRDGLLLSVIVWKAKVTGKKTVSTDNAFSSQVKGEREPGFEPTTTGLSAQQPIAQTTRPVQLTGIPRSSTKTGSRLLLKGRPDYK